MSGAAPAALQADLRSRSLPRVEILSHLRRKQDIIASRLGAERVVGHVRCLVAKRVEVVDEAGALWCHYSGCLEIGDDPRA